MKSIEFGEEGLANLQEIGQALFADSQNPGSPGYRRKLVRPKINWLAVALRCLAPAAAAVGLFFALNRWLQLSTGQALGVCIGLSAGYALLMLKISLISVVRIYQRFAPASIRCKCRFEPSCSHYMIASLEKYGALRGLKKGVARLRRCNIHNGGFDPP